MNPSRFLLAGGLALFAALTASAQEGFARAAEEAANRSRAELEELYAQGEQKLAPPWRGLRVTDDAAVFVRADPTPAGKNQVTIWTERELPVPGYFEKEKPYLSVRERFVAECNARRIGLAEWVYYSGRYGSGAPVARDRIAQPEMSEPLPDSLEEQIHGAACPKPLPKSPAPKPKPKKAAAKPAADDGKEAKDKKAASEAKKDAPKKEAAKPAASGAKAPAKAAKATSVDVPMPPRRKIVPEPMRRPQPAKKPAPEEDAGKATTTAGRR